jgi:thioredoxin-related protein
MRHLNPLCGLLAASLAVIFFRPALSAHPEKSPGLFRHPSYLSAWKSSKVTGRPMLVYCTMDGCHYCRKMEEESYTQPVVTGRLASEYEPVAVMRARRPDLIKKLRVRIFPTTFVVAPGGKILDRIEGFIPPEQLAARLAPKRTARSE